MTQARSACRTSLLPTSAPEAIRASFCVHSPSHLPPRSRRSARPSAPPPGQPGCPPQHTLPCGRDLRAEGHSCPVLLRPTSPSGPPAQSATSSGSSSVANAGSASETAAPTGSAFFSSDTSDSSDSSVFLRLFLGRDWSFRRLLGRPGRLGGACHPQALRPPPSARR